MLSNFFKSRKNQLVMIYIILAVLFYFVLKHPAGVENAGQPLLNLDRLFYVVTSVLGIGAVARIYQAQKKKAAGFKPPDLVLSTLQSWMMNLPGLLAVLAVVGISSVRFYYSYIDFTTWFLVYDGLLISYVGGNVDGKKYLGTFGDGTA